MIIDFSAGMKAGAEMKVEAGTPALLARNILIPHLERIPLDCGNCGFLVFVVMVSPLKGEVGAAAVLQEIQCAKCGARFRVHDGVIGGHQKEPIATPGRP